MSLKRYIKGFGYALTGIAYSFRSQVNMRFHVFAAVVVFIAALFFRISPVEWCILILCVGSVISAELINTAIEANVDLFTKEHNEKAANAKDLAAGAVLIVAIISAVIGSIIFIPKIIHLFN